MSRSRSPNYPALSLPQAVERIRSVYESQFLTPESKDVVVKHMGYNSVNGRSAKSLSALLKYGLLDEEDGGFKVSARALDIIEPQLESDKDSALREAAYSPKLFADLFDRYEMKPTHASLSAYLVRQGFTLKAVDAVAKSFEETFDLVVSLDDATESPSALASVPSEAIHPFGELGAQLFGTTSKPSASAKEVSMSPPSTVEIEMNCTRPVFDFDTVQIVTRIDNQSDLSALMERLEAIKTLLPKKAADAAPADSENSAPTDN